MSMINDNTPSIKPDNATFYSLFIETRNSVFYVPNFQRSYAWDVSPHVEQFLRDLRDCYEIEKLERIKYQHFLGQIILRRASERDTDGIEYFEVIDGQQRLITFFMLCISIYEKTKQIVNRNSSLVERGRTILDNVKSVLFLGTHCRLVLSKKDNSFWTELIDYHTKFHGIELDGSKSISHKKMLIAVNKISAFLDELLQEKDDMQRVVLIEDIFTALTKRMHIITVTSEPTEYMFALFQTVNDRGRLLTNGELLRAKTLEALRDNVEMQHQAEQYWDGILQDDEKTTDLILEWCYISATGKEIEKNPSIFHQYLENYFIEARKRHVNDEEKVSLLSKICDLHKDVETCRLLQAGTWPFFEDTRPEWQKQRLGELVCRLRHTKAIPILLSLVSIGRTSDEKEKEKVFDDFYETVDLIDRFFFVYKKIAACDEKNFASAYNRYAYSIRTTGSNLQKLSYDLHRIEKEADCDYYLNAYLTQPLYSKKRVHTTEMHLLYLIELFYSSSPEYRNLSTIDDAVVINIDRLSIEHIYPKNAKESLADERLEPYKHYLGNLTLLGKKKNNEADNAPFENKKAVYEASSFRMTREIASAERWTVDEFNKRQKHLSELAKYILSIPSGDKRDPK